MGTSGVTVGVNIQIRKMTRRRTNDKIVTSLVTVFLLHFNYPGTSILFRISISLNFMYFPHPGAVAAADVPALAGRKPLSRRGKQLECPVFMDNEAQQPTAPTKKSVDEIASEVIAGKLGNGDDRRNRLTTAGYNYSAVQSKVNEKLGATANQSAVYYTVKRGDTLSAIASKYGTSVSAIQKLNSSLMKNVNLIQVGWRIRVK